MGPKSPKIPILGTWIGISSQICEKIQIAISSDLCIRLTWHLTGSCGQQERLRGWSRMVVKQFQDGGRTPFWKSLYHHISVKNNPIFMKFCTQQQILNWMNVTWSKMKKLHWTNSKFTERISCSLPHDAMHKHGICRHVVSVCLSRSWIMSKRININFHHRVATPF